MTKTRRPGRPAAAVPPAVRLTAAERRAWLELAHVGPATVGDLELLGMRRLADLRRSKPEALYARLCRLTACRQDPCVLDVFAMLTSLARGKPARPWWEFSRRRLAEAAASAEARPRAGGAVPRSRKAGKRGVSARRRARSAGS